MSDVSSSPLALARHYASIGQPQRVLDALDRLQQPHEAEAWALRGDALYQLDRYHEGADAARRGLEFEPENAVLLDVLALNLIELDDLAGAERALLAALEQWPEDTALISHYAFACARGGQGAKARKLLDRAAALSPGDVDVLRSRAQVAQLMGDRNAGRYIDELLAAEPDDRVGHVLRANLFVERRQIGAAVRHFEHATRLDPTDHDTARVTRYNRTLTHWTQWPLWPLQRFGPLKVWAAYLVVFFASSAAGVIEYVWPVIVLYLLLVVYSWTIGPLSRWWLRRKL